jgi:hypothetical protein
LASILVKNPTVKRLWWDKGVTVSVVCVVDTS